MPEANAVELKRVSMPSSARKSGCAVFDKLLPKEKAQRPWIARGKGDVPSHLYLSEHALQVDKPDSRKLSRLRVSPITAPSSQGWRDASPDSAIRDLYVDGAQCRQRLWLAHSGNPTIRLFSGHKRRLDPGFFVAPNKVLIDLNVWSKLTPAQRKVSTRRENGWRPVDQFEFDENQKARDLQAKNGMAASLSAGKSPKIFADAYDSGVGGNREDRAEHAPRLRELMS